LDRLLFVSYYEPKADHPGNRELCEKYFTQHSPAVRECIYAGDMQTDGPSLLRNDNLL
jgi:hypothetical protein